MALQRSPSMYSAAFSGGASAPSFSAMGWPGRLGPGRPGFMPDMSSPLAAQQHWSRQLLQSENEKGETGRARLAQEAAMYPHSLKQDRFNRIFPYLQNALGGLSAGFGGGGGGGGGPAIYAGPIWSQGQIQQQVNAQRAASARQTGTAQRNIAQQLAGQGYGSRSPLQAALQGQQAMAGYGREADIDRQIRWEAALGNAENIMKGQGLQVQDAASRRQADIDRARIQLNYQQGLLGILSQLM